MLPSMLFVDMFGEPRTADAAKIPISEQTSDSLRPNIPKDAMVTWGAARTLDRFSGYLSSWKPLFAKTGDPNEIDLVDLDEKTKSKSERLLVS